MFPHSKLEEQKQKLLIFFPIKRIMDTEQKGKYLEERSLNIRENEIGGNKY